MGVTSDPRFNEEDAQIIKMKTRKFVKQFRFLRGDAKDLEQEAALHVAFQMHRCTPARGTRAAFVNKITGNLLLNHVASATARKRDRRLEVQIDEVGASLLLDRLPGTSLVDRRLDLDEALKSLPADLRWIADLLKVHPVADVMAITGLTRGEVRSRMKQMGRALKKLGVCD